MKTSLFILPFLALLVGIIGSSIGSAFPEVTLATPLAWASAGAIIALWVALDFENFKAFFTRKGARYGYGSGVVFIIGVAIFVGIAILTNKPRFNKSIDVTKTGINTLSDQSIKVIDAINKKEAQIDVIAFFKDDNVKTKFKSLISLYEREKANFAFEYINTQQNPTRVMAEKLTSANTVIFRRGDQEARVTTFNEEKVTNALIKVIKEKTKKIYFTKGHGEGQIRGSEASGFDLVVRQLENNKYEVKELSIIEEAKVPEDADLLIIAGPQYDFKLEEARIVEEYLKRGGALLVMVDAVAQAKNLNQVMEKFGFRFNSDLLLLNPEDPRALLFGQNNAVVSDFDDFNPVTKDFARQSAVEFLIPNMRSLSQVKNNPNNMSITLAAKTSNVTVRVRGVETESDLKDIAQDRIDTGEKYTVIVVAKGKAKAPDIAEKSADGSAEDKTTDVSAKAAEAPKDKEIRIVAVGSSHFARNQGAQTGSNRDLFTNMANYLLQDEDFISIRPKDLNSGQLNLNSSMSQLLLILFSWLYPFIFLGSGVVYWLRRKSA